MPPLRLDRPAPRPALPLIDRAGPARQARPIDRDERIERALRALVKRRCGCDDLDALEEEFVAELREDVIAVLDAAAG